MLHGLKYFTRHNGEEPVYKWLCELEEHDRQRYFTITSKIDKLELEGFKLLGTQMMKRIADYDDLYELIGGQCRILVYFDTLSNDFILLYGFLKKRRTEPREIRKGLGFLDEYLSSR